MTAGATASDSPFIQGRNARVYGKTRESCPYSEGSEDRVAWLQAWDEAGADQTSADANQPVEGATGHEAFDKARVESQRRE